ncbi:MFS general substrate transporter [Tothia fuscella]|uniref:MFS general substrate transporter n=1 Tax=Tothia fuscella TaxID=1048955 RepID=A0A9P4NJI4_9PEZI|nr:MFS general substrate transporter [Tothia fuscella]
MSTRSRSGGAPATQSRTSTVQDRPLDGETLSSLKDELEVNLPPRPKSTGSQIFSPQPSHFAQTGPFDDPFSQQHEDHNEIRRSQTVSPLTEADLAAAYRRSMTASPLGEGQDFRFHGQGHAGFKGARSSIASGPARYSITQTSGQWYTNFDDRISPPKFPWIGNKQSGTRLDYAPSSIYSNDRDSTTYAPSNSDCLSHNPFSRYSVDVPAPLNPSKSTLNLVNPPSSVSPQGDSFTRASKPFEEKKKNRPSPLLLHESALLRPAAGSSPSSPTVETPTNVRERIKSSSAIIEYMDRSLSPGPTIPSPVLSRKSSPVLVRRSPPVGVHRPLLTSYPLLSHEIPVDRVDTFYSTVIGKGVSSSELRSLQTALDSPLWSGFRRQRNIPRMGSLPSIRERSNIFEAHEDSLQTATHNRAGSISQQYHESTARDERRCAHAQVDPDVFSPTISDKNETLNNRFSLHFLPLTHVEVERKYIEGWRLHATATCMWFGCFLVWMLEWMTPTAIPGIATDLHGIRDMGLYGTAFLFTFAVFTPVLHRLYRLFDHRWVYCAAVMLFAGGNALCAANPTSLAFILCRGLAGIGAAGVVQGSSAILNKIVAPSTRDRCIGITGSAFVIALVLGPILSGAILAQLGWQWILWITALCCIPLFGLVACLPCISGQREGDQMLKQEAKLFEIPIIETALLFTAITLLVIAFSLGGDEVSFRSDKVLGMLIGAALVLIVFFGLQCLRRSKALISLASLRRPVVLWGSLFSFFNFGIITVLAYILPMYFQASLGSSAISSALQYLPLAAVQVLAILLAQTIRRNTFGSSLFVVFGGIFTLVGVLLLSRHTFSHRIAEWQTILILVGIGTGSAILFPFHSLQKVLSGPDRVTGHMILTFFSLLGSCVFLAVAQNIFMNIFATAVHISLPILSDDIMITGPIHLEKLNFNTTLLEFVEEGFAKASSKAMVLCLVLSVLVLPVSYLLIWTVFKEEARPGRDAGVELDGQEMREV